VSSEPKWTKGPWTLDRSGRISAHLKGADGRYIVSFPVGADYWHEPEGWDLTQDGADARLMTSAPELYEALAEFLREADVGHVSVKTDRKARAALAAARGEQPTKMGD